MSDKEKQLLKSAQSGSVDAFEELIQPYRIRIFNLMLKTCCNEFEASQLTQVVFVRVFESLLRGINDGGLSYNIYRIAGEISRLSSCKSKMIS